MNASDRQWFAWLASESPDEPFKGDGRKRRATVTP